MNAIQWPERLRVKWNYGGRTIARLSTPVSQSAASCHPRLSFKFEVDLYVACTSAARASIALSRDSGAGAPTQGNGTRLLSSLAVDFPHICGTATNVVITNPNNRSQVQNCEWDGIADKSLHHRVSAYPNVLRSLGVDGFRIDAAKNTPADDIRDILSKVVGLVCMSRRIRIAVSDLKAMHARRNTCKTGTCMCKVGFVVINSGDAQWDTALDTGLSSGWRGWVY
ncbi:hypothetical protein AB1N83_009344 [Pleurotus pulmonarius]